VASGIQEVQYIEPYPKSRALSLHGDSITSRVAAWLSPAAFASWQEESAGEEKKSIAKPAQAKDTHLFKMVGNKKFGLDTNAGKVLFRPFTGVAPRLYHRAFTKDRPLKNDTTGQREIGQPDWGGRWGIRTVPYTVLEARLTVEDGDAPQP